MKPRLRVVCPCCHNETREALMSSSGLHCLGCDCDSHQLLHGPVSKALVAAGFVPGPREFCVECRAEKRAAKAAGKAKTK